MNKLTQKEVVELIERNEVTDSSSERIEEIADRVINQWWESENLLDADTLSAAEIDSYRRRLEREIAEITEILNSNTNTMKEKIYGAEIESLEYLNWDFDYEDIEKALGVDRGEAEKYQKENYYVIIKASENGVWQYYFHSNQSYEVSDKKDADQYQTPKDIAEGIKMGIVWIEA